MSDRELTRGYTPVVREAKAEYRCETGDATYGSHTRASPMGVALHANPYRHVVHSSSMKGRNMNIRRALVALAATAALVLVGAGPAFAGGSPHFIKSATGASLDGTSLVVHFKEAGLASGAVETIQATAHLDATYQCINGGGNNPNDPKKTTISSDVSQSGVFTAGQNGNIVGSLTLSAPAAATVLDCPSGQTATLTAVKWSHVHVDDLTSGASLAVSGTFTA